jgi:SNF2 family DNA or RNA helicase
LNWSLELYQQANARLHRMNQTKPVIVYHLVATKTIDGDVMQALAGKAETQESLMQAIKVRIKKYKS